MSRRTPSMANSRAAAGIVAATSLSTSAREPAPARRRFSGAWARGAVPARAASSPARKPRRLASAALPSSRIAASNASAAIGSRPQPASETEHHGVDHGAALLRQRLHVDEQRSLRVLADRLDQPLRVVAAVRHRHLFRDQIGARRGSNHHGSVGRDEAAGDGAPGLHQFARHHDVDVADAGRERQHRPAAAKVGPWHRHDLDVIGGGAGALGDAGDRGALHREAGCPPRRRSSW